MNADVGRKIHVRDRYRRYAVPDVNLDGCDPTDCADG